MNVITASAIIATVLGQSTAPTLLPIALGNSTAPSVVQFRESSMIPLDSGGCTLYTDTDLGGQPQELWCGDTQYLFSGPGAGISESGWVPLTVMDPSEGWATLSCSGDWFGYPLPADWIRTGVGYIHTGCTPRNWDLPNDPQDGFGVDLHFEWRTSTISHGYRFQFVMENRGTETIPTETYGNKWGLFPQVHILASALDPDRAWHLDSDLTWRQFPSVPGGSGWLDFDADWKYPSGDGIGISQGNFGIALITPSRRAMPIKRMTDPAGDGSVPDQTFFGSSFAMPYITPGRHVTRAFLLIGTLAEIANTTYVLRQNGEI